MGIFKRLFRDEYVDDLELENAYLKLFNTKQNKKITKLEREVKEAKELLDKVTTESKAISCKLREQTKEARKEACKEFMEKELERTRGLVRDSLICPNWERTKLSFCAKEDCPFFCAPQIVVNSHSGYDPYVETTVVGWRCSLVEKEVGR